MISSYRNKCVILVCTALASSWIAYPEPAVAQWGNFVGGMIGGVIGGVLSGGHRGRPPRTSSKRQEVHSARRHGQSSRETATSQEESSSPGKSSRKDDRILAALAPPTAIQTVVLKNILPSNALGTVGSNDDLNRIGEANSKEEERDYAAQIADLIKRFKTAAENANEVGDITEYAIVQAIDSAYKEADLRRFETFSGENWSVERLRVMILGRVDAEVGSLFQGTNKGQVSMDDLRSIIHKSARVIYLRLFETSELLAANRSSALFVQRLYQAHGEQMQGDVREGAERMLMQASAHVSGKFDGLIRRDESSYALHYRQQRIIFDCLSDNVERISSTGQGIATIDEIKQRISDVETQQCIAWVSNQLVGPDGKLKPQEPMPLRAIWTAEGPRDDPSMYGRPIGPQ